MDHRETGATSGHKYTSSAPAPVNRSRLSAVVVSIGDSAVRRGIGPDVEERSNNPAAPLDSVPGHPLRAQRTLAPAATAACASVRSRSEPAAAPDGHSDPAPREREASSGVRVDGTDRLATRNLQAARIDQPIQELQATPRLDPPVGGGKARRRLRHWTQTRRDVSQSSAVCNPPYEHERAHAIAIALHEIHRRTSEGRDAARGCGARLLRARNRAEKSELVTSWR